MGAIKKTPADNWFSKCVRARAGFKCQRCGAQHLENSMGLHCSHFHGRGVWSVRFDPDNAFSLCYGCHKYVESRPVEHQQFALSMIGLDRYEALQARANDLSLGRQLRKTKGKGDISKHFKKQFEQMQEYPDYREIEAWG